MTPTDRAARPRLARRAVLAALAVAALPRGVFAQSDPAPPATSSVHLVSDPPGAEVRLDARDGPLLGTTPVEGAAIPPGWHTLFFARAGYSAYELRVQIAAGVDSVRVTLVRTTSLRVVSPAPGAEVSIDGSPAGVTPIDVDGLSPGAHRVEVRGPNGQVFRASVRLRPGTPSTVRARFRR